MANGMNVDIVSALNDVKDRYQRFSGARGNAHGDAGSPSLL